MKILTSAYTIQSDEQHHDVECTAEYEGNDERLWKRRVWFDKEAKEIVESDIYEFSKDDSDGFEEIHWEDIPRDIRECLDGRVDAAKDDILAPLMEDTEEEEEEEEETPERKEPKRLSSIETGEVQLEVIECTCGYHMGIDATYLEQVSDFTAICPSCQRELWTEKIIPA